MILLVLVLVWLASFVGEGAAVVVAGGAAEDVALTEGGKEEEEEEVGVLHELLDRLDLAMRLL